MGIFGSGNLRAEVEELLKELESQINNTDNQNSEKFRQLNLKVDRLITRMDELESQIVQLKNLVKTPSVSENLQMPVAPGAPVQPTTTTIVSSNPSNIVKLIYTGFNQGVFTVPLRLGVGDSWLKNAKANFVLECEKGQTEGSFYPNPDNLKILAFNPQSNLSPVCDIVPGDSGTVVKPGVVTLDPTTNGWKVTVKCQIAL